MKPFADLLVSCLMLLALTAMAAEPAASPHLEPFRPFLNKTWRGLVDAEKGVYDVARWELALAGQAVRIRHSVGDGAYGGETFVMWDRELESLVYYYFTTAGFYTHGTMELDAAGRLSSREEVSGHAGGIEEVHSVQEVLDGGRLRVRTRMRRGETWEDRPEVIYEHDPKAEVVLP